MSIGNLAYVKFKSANKGFDSGEVTIDKILSNPDVYHTELLKLKSCTVGQPIITDRPTVVVLHSVM